ncbi:hypothetical protein H4219_004842 [Mycoemilia scoparia]|uniref:Uncharacterized protein n=1 Tax=Mycoemilia scoparia TaxID=417184 RepID=A0A9W8DQG4_9FUNG|nr:hypothetical protein H4219_004842 [Mycoemilia scoparia]
MFVDLISSDEDDVIVTPASSSSSASTTATAVPLAKRPNGRKLTATTTTTSSSDVGANKINNSRVDNIRQSRRNSTASSSGMDVESVTHNHDEAAPASSSAVSMVATPQNLNINNDIDATATGLTPQVSMLGLASQYNNNNTTTQKRNQRKRVVSDISISDDSDNGFESRSNGYRRSKNPRLSNTNSQTEVQDPQPATVAEKEVGGGGGGGGGRQIISIPPTPSPSSTPSTSATPLVIPANSIIASLQEAPDIYSTLPIIELDSSTDPAPPTDTADHGSNMNNYTSRLQSIRGRNTARRTGGPPQNPIGSASSSQPASIFAKARNIGGTPPTNNHNSNMRMHSNSSLFSTTNNPRTFSLGNINRIGVSSGNVSSNGLRMDNSAKFSNPNLQSKSQLPSSSSHTVRDKNDNGNVSLWQLADAALKYRNDKSATTTSFVPSTSLAAAAASSTTTNDDDDDDVVVVDLTSPETMTRIQSVGKEFYIDKFGQNHQIEVGHQFHGMNDPSTLNMLVGLGSLRGCVNVEDPQALETVKQSSASGGSSINGTAAAGGGGGGDIPVKLVRDVRNANNIIRVENPRTGRLYGYLESAIATNLAPLMSSQKIIISGAVQKSKEHAYVAPIFISLFSKRSDAKKLSEILGNNINTSSGGAGTNDSRDDGSGGRLDLQPSSNLPLSLINRGGYGLENFIDYDPMYLINNNYSGLDYDGSGNPGGGDSGRTDNHLPSVFSKMGLHSIGSRHANIMMRLGGVGQAPKQIPRDFNNLHNKGMSHLPQGIYHNPIDVVENVQKRLAEIKSAFVTLLDLPEIDVVPGSIKTRLHRHQKQALYFMLHRESDDVDIEKEEPPVDVADSDDDGEAIKTISLIDDEEEEEKDGDIIGKKPISSKSTTAIADKNKTKDANTVFPVLWKIAKRQVHPKFIQRNPGAKSYKIEYIHEITGLRMMAKPQPVRGGILGDDMGLGKTLTIISLILSAPPVWKLGSRVKDRDDNENKPIGNESLLSKNKTGDNSSKVKPEKSRKGKEKEPSINGDNSGDRKLDMDSQGLNSSDFEYDFGFESTSKPNVSESEPESEHNNNNNNDDDDDDDDDDEPTKFLDECEAKFAKRYHGKYAGGTLVICPLSIVGNWEQQIATHTKKNSLSVYVYHGPQRTSLAKYLCRYDVVITTYNVLQLEYSKEIAQLKIKDEKNTASDTTIDGVISDSDDEDSDGEIHGTNYLSGGGPAAAAAANNTRNPSKIHFFKIPKKPYTSPLQTVNWHRVVLDEAHVIKERKTGQSKAAHAITATRRWCLTGTPIQNRLDDLYSLIRFLHVVPLDIFGVWAKHVGKPFYANPNDFVNKTEGIETRNAGARRVQLLMQSLCLRRTKLQLDPKTNTPMLKLLPKIEATRWLELEPAEKELYKKFEKQAKSKVDKLNREGRLLENYMIILLVILRLRQLCAHPALWDQKKWNSLQDRSSGSDRNSSNGSSNDDHSDSELVTGSKACKSGPLAKKRNSNSLPDVKNLLKLDGGRGGGKGSSSSAKFNRKSSCSGGGGGLLRDIVNKSLPGKLGTISNSNSPGSSGGGHSFGIQAAKKLWSNAKSKSQHRIVYCDYCDFQIPNITDDDGATSLSAYLKLLPWATKCGHIVCSQCCEETFPNFYTLKSHTLPNDKVKCQKCKTILTFYSIIRLTREIISEKDERKTKVKTEKGKAKDIEEVDSKVKPESKPKITIATKDEQDNYSSSGSSSSDDSDSMDLKEFISPPKRRITRSQSKTNSRNQTPSPEEDADLNSSKHKTTDIDPKKFNTSTKVSALISDLLYLKNGTQWLDSDQPHPSFPINKTLHADHIRATKTVMASSTLSASEKSVIFSQWTHLLDLIEKSLKKHGLKFTRLDGTMSLAARKTAIHKFENDPTTNIFLISLKAGGVGLNLTCASHVFMMDPYWNPSVERQAIDRVHRLGQKKLVTVTRYVIKDSIEERIMELQKRKSKIMEVSLLDKKREKKTYRDSDGNLVIEEKEEEEETDVGRNMMYGRANDENDDDDDLGIVGGGGLSVFGAGGSGRNGNANGGSNGNRKERIQQLQFLFNNN